MEADNADNARTENEDSDVNAEADDAANATENIQSDEDLDDMMEEASVNVSENDGEEVEADNTADDAANSEEPEGEQEEEVDAIAKNSEPEVEQDEATIEASPDESEKNEAEAKNTAKATENNIEPEGGQDQPQKEASSGKNGLATNKTAAKVIENSEPEELSPPSWQDVTWDKLKKYPKISLRAHTYFDIQQIRAIKPVTLLSMGIGVPKFPDLEDDAIMNIAVHRSTKFQLYHPTDVFPSKSRAKSHLTKEILRRAILHNLEGLGEDATQSDVGMMNSLQKKEKLRSGIPTYLPRPGNYTLAQCHDWLKNNPPPKEEHAFLLRSVKQWRQQVRDQMARIHPKTKDVEAALEDFDEARKKDQEEEEVAVPGTAPVTATVNTMPITNGLTAAFQNFQNHIAPPAMGSFNPFNTQLAAAVNMNNIQALAISQYQAQLAALQTALTATSNQTQFEIFVSKDTFKFNASHFVAFPGFRERLHGHSYKASVKLIGNHQIGRDGYVLDFGCVKSVAKEVCKQLNEYFLVPTLSEVLKITVVGDGEDGDLGTVICGDCADENAGGGKSQKKKNKKRKRENYPGSVTIECEDGSIFVFPKQDCLLLPIMHSTAEELAIYLFGKIVQKLDASYLHKRGVKVMEVTVSEAVGQDAIFRRAIPLLGGTGNEFDVASYISKEAVPVMPCATETEAAKQKK